MTDIVYNKDQLVASFEAHTKPKNNWKIGLEYEIFPYEISTKMPLNNQKNSNGIEKLFIALKNYGWETKYDDDVIISLLKGSSNITLEPGGQLELSSTPHMTLHEVYRELQEYTTQLTLIGNKLGISFITLGYHPEWMLKDIPKLPNRNNRYNIISRYFNKFGRYGTDMMYRTCSAQTSLDYGAESDMVKKYRVILALQPVLTAIFSNSPFVNGKPSSHLSARSYAWSKANPERTGVFPVVFEEGFGFERYVDFALDMPLYLIYRNGKYIDANGQPFRDFLNASLSILPGELPTLNDWMNHIGTIWPEVRLKNVLEIRGIDSGPITRVCATAALATGLLYNESSLEAAWDIIKNWNHQTRNQLYVDVIDNGLNSIINNIPTREIAKEILDIAYIGLKARNFTGNFGQTETSYLDCAYEIVESGKSPANILLSNYYTQWNNSVRLETINPF